MATSSIPNAGDYKPPRINRYVPNCRLDANVGGDGITRIYFGALTAGTATAISTAIQMVNGSAVVQSYSASQGIVGGVGAPFGRNLQFVASSTNTRAMTVEGVDFMGQPLIETVTLTSGTICFSKKAFYKVNKITFASASDTTTVNVGTSNRFGVPYAIQKCVGEAVNGVMSPYYQDPVALAVNFNQTDLLAPTAQRTIAPFKGYVTKLLTNVQVAITTGGTLQVKKGATVVTGAVVTVANSATAGTAQSATPTDPYSEVIGSVASAGDINVLPASFATAGAVNTLAELTPYGIIPLQNTQSLTSYDPRGLYEPSVTPDASKIFEVIAYVDVNNTNGMLGAAHVVA